jgi:hypothetical protein
LYASTICCVVTLGNAAGGGVLPRPNCHQFKTLEPALYISISNLVSEGTRLLVTPNIASRACRLVGSATSASSKPHCFSCHTTFSRVSTRCALALLLGVWGAPETGPNGGVVCPGEPGPICVVIVVSPCGSGILSSLLKTETSEPKIAERSENLL